jgi:hypothetical protein
LASSIQKRANKPSRRSQVEPHQNRIGGQLCFYGLVDF